MMIRLYSLTFIGFLLSTPASASKDFNASGLAKAMKKVKCELVVQDKASPLSIQEGKSGTALDESKDKLSSLNGHQVGVFYYPDDSLGLVIDEVTSTIYKASMLSPNLLAFLSMKDGTEVKCYSHPVYGTK